MNRGHGELGLLDNLRTFSDLIDDVDSQRRAYLDIFPGITLTSGWTLNSGATYVYGGLISYMFGGVTQDVVGVDTSLGSLVRVETLADCIATAGTYYAVANVGDLTATSRWDDGVTHWDDVGATWDHVVTVDLYVHLAGGANPNTATVVPLLGFAFGTRGEVHPQLGPDKLTNGGFESLTGWTTRIQPGWDDGVTHWDDGTVYDSAAFTGALDSTLVYGRGSTFSLKLASSGTVVGFVSALQDVPTVAQASYRFYFYYRTNVGFSANLAARILVGNTAGTTVLYADGRDGDASGQVTLTPTAGEWRRAFFDFIAPATTTRVTFQLRAPSSAGAGQFNVDGAGLKRVYRYVFYDPRIATASLPAVEVKSQTIFFAGKTDGQGQYALINSDGALESLFATLLLHGKPATAYVGGSFVDGQELYRDDWRAGWPGVSQRVEITDEVVQIDADDARNFLHVDLPTRVHSLLTEPNLNVNDEGSGRGLLFHASTTSLIKGVRTGLTANGYGIYELADGAASLAGIFTDGTFPRPSVYSTEDLAGKDQLGFTTQLLIGTHYTVDAASGQVTVIDDIRNYLVDRTTGKAPVFVPQFLFNNSLLTGFASVTGFAYRSATQFAATLQASMNSVVGVADISVTYSHSTHKFTISKGAGVLNLIMTGSTAYIHAWAILGFDESFDHTGSLSYTAENATFTSPDVDHIVRFATYGLKDDAAGAITGTPGANVAKHADVAKYLLTQYLKIPLAQIDVASFTAGAAAEVQALVGVELRDQTPSLDFFRRLEAGAIADLNVDGDNVWHWTAYAAGAAVTRAFFDRDFLSFGVVKDPANIYSSARVSYGQNPARDSDKAYEVALDTGVQTKHRRLEVLQVDTWIDSSAAADTAAQLVGQRMSRLAAANPRIVTFQARGKAVDLLLGDIITVTRARAFDATGTLAATRFRVTGLAHNFLEGVSTVTACEDVSFLS